jgi:phosphoglycerol transferase MdoB-like AlkP superfamily enzyme
MKYGSRVKFLVVCLLVSMFVFADARIFFFLFHKCRLGGEGASGLFQAMFYGLPFDLAAVIFVNSIFIFLVAFPLSFFHSKVFRISLKTIFVVANIVALLANMVDMAYFPYTLRRTTLDAISFFLEKNDAGTLLPVFLMDFWYLVAIFLFYIFGLIWIYKIIEKKFLSPYQKEERNPKQLFLKLNYFIIIIVFAFIGFNKNLTILDAGRNVKPGVSPMVLNTPFCLMRSGELYTLEEKNYMSEEEAQKIFNPEKKYDFPDSTFKNYNVVVIIVESMSKEYTKLGKRESHTPFLDSLMDYGLVFLNAFSNGKRSIEGIPAVVASMPSFQYDYISTLYNENKITSLGNVLKDKGYTSSFFHGGSNGTMNFNGFCKTAGFDLYFGRNEYANEKDYDNKWGIWDEPFLQRMSDELGKQKQPFVTAVFTLSSHHPYEVPEIYKDKFAEGKLPIHKCINYTDYSIKRFFESAKTKKWFRNTLFVITADHTGVSADPVFAGPYGSYEIPLLFYLPDNSLQGKDVNVAQQTDIMPTILSVLHFNKPFFSFGTNLMAPVKANERFATNYYNTTYQYITNENLIQFNGERVAGLFNYHLDSTLNFNIADRPEITERLTKRALAFLQQYNNRVIHNRTYVK